MQPDQQNNYWQSDESQSKPDKITGMYAPTQDDDQGENTKNTPINIKEPIENSAPVHWSASEYIGLDKNKTWYIVFFLVLVALIAIDIIIFKEYTFSVLIVVMATTIIIHSNRPPKQINYSLSVDQGLYIDEKLYHFGDFKAFGLMRDRGQHSIMLIPIKRFSLPVSVYFPEDAGERIVDILGSRLPMENIKMDIIDIIAQKLRL